MDVSRGYIRRTVAVCAIVLAFAALAAMLMVAADVFLLGFAGILFAVMLRGLARQVAHHTGLSVPLALACTGLVLVSVLALACVCIGPRVAVQADQLSQRLPEAAAVLQQRLAEQP